MPLRRRELRLSSGVRRLGASVGLNAGTFSPLSLSPAIWLKADVGTYQTFPSVPAVSDGDAVAKWLDQSGNNNHPVVNGIAPNISGAALNGRNTVRGDGAASNLTVTFGSPVAFPFHVILAARFLRANAAIDVLLSNSSGNTIGLHHDATTHYVFNGGTVATFSASLAAHVFSFRWASGTSVTVNVDGGADIPLAPGTGVGTQLDGLSLFAVPTPSNFALADIGELVVYSGALSTLNRNNVEAYLKSRWATP